MSSASFRTAPSHHPYKVEYPESSRQSYSEPPDAIFQGRPSRSYSYSRPASDEPTDPDQDPIIRGVQYSEQQIPHGIYQARESRRGPYSPTASVMNFEI